MSYINASEKKSPLRAMAGLVGSLVGLAFLWAGGISFLVGVAYRHQKGSWTPVLAGIVLVVFGLVILVKGVRLILKNLTELYDDEEGL